MTSSLIHMVNNLDASTDDQSLKYILLGKPHHERNPHHPSYMDMIKGAIQAINNGRGSSKAAILKFIAQNYHVGENLPKVNSHLRMVLNKAVDSGDIEQARGHGASGSFRLVSKHEKMLQVVPITTPTPMMMLHEIESTTTEPMKKTKSSKMDKGKKRGRKMRKSTPRVKKHQVVTKNKNSTKGTEKIGKPKSGMKPEAAPTTTMKLRDKPRKHYA